MNFEKALRQAFRYSTSRGMITTENLWGLPLKSADGFDLDHVARETNRLLKEMTEESFVEVSTNPEKGRLEEQLEIIKYVIATKLREKEDAEKAVKRRNERSELLEILEKRQRLKKEELPTDEIKKRLDALSVSA